jgi:hypothetical protein
MERLIYCPKCLKVWYGVYKNYCYCEECWKEWLGEYGEREIEKIKAEKDYFKA